MDLSFKSMYRVRE